MSLDFLGAGVHSPLDPESSDIAHPVDVDAFPSKDLNLCHGKALELISIP